MFMQRANQKEEKSKKEEEVKPDDTFFSLNTIKRKCVVVMEEDPHPGATKGRMSFQNFNPAIDASIRSCELKSFQRLFSSCASIVAFVLLISKPWSW